MAVGQEAEDCWLVGEAPRLEFLLLRAEKSTRSSLLDSCSVVLGAQQRGWQPQHAGA